MPGGAVILLDLDGTLTDPREGILRCFKYALARAGASIPADEELESYIGPPLRESLAYLLGTENAARLDDAIAFYRQRFAAQGMFENRIYPGVVRPLTELQALGASLFVATSKPQVFADGSELDGSRSNKGELISWLLDRETLSASNTAMVGDRAQDITGARANGVFPIGVLWGYGSRDELVSAGAAALCKRPNRLVETVLRSYPFRPTPAVFMAR
jgi:phosphoglycolate phosphatase